MSFYLGYDTMTAARQPELPEAIMRDIISDRDLVPTVTVDPVRVKAASFLRLVASATASLASKLDDSAQPLAA